MKKVIALILVLVLMMGLFTACKSDTADNNSSGLSSAWIPDLNQSESETTGSEDESSKDESTVTSDTKPDQTTSSGNSALNQTGGAEMREKITLACTECKQRNYDSKKNKKNTPDRLELNKYCRFCRKHTLHKETK